MNLRFDFSNVTKFLQELHAVGWVPIKGLYTHQITYITTSN